MTKENLIIKKYPYRQKGVLVAIYMTLFIIVPIVLPKTTGWIIGISLVGCLIAYQLVEAIQSWQNPFRKKVAFTENSIIGPSWNKWRGEIPYNEVEFLFSDIKNMNLKVGKRLAIEIMTSSKRMNLQYGYLDKADFKEVYDHLSKNLNKPSFDEVAPPFLIRRCKGL